MGWFSKAWKKVKNVFKKVTKVVKKVVKSVGKAAKKVWSGVKKGANKLSKGLSKLGPFANIAMNFIPGFGQLWSAYGIWGQMAKGALVGFATTGEASGALLGAAVGGIGDIFNKMPGANVSEKVGNWFNQWTDTGAINKATNYGGQPFTRYTPKSNFKSFPKPVDPTYKLNADDLTLGVGEKVYDSAYPFADKGTYHMKDGQLLLGKAPAGTPLMGRSTIDPTPFVQEAIKAGQYHKPKPESSLLDKLRKGTQAYSALKGAGDYDTAGLQLPYNAYDTSALTAYDTTAGGTRGQVGWGTDVYDVNKLGLLAAIDRIRRSEQEFGVA